MKTRAERLRYKKLLLFLLLELRSYFLSFYFDPIEHSQELSKHLQKILINFDAEIEPDHLSFFETIYEKIFLSQASSSRPKVDSHFISTLEKVLEEVSKNDPILVFKLRGKEQIIEYLHEADKHIQELMNFENGIYFEGCESSIKGFIGDQKFGFIKEAIEDINSYIDMVSWECGVVVWLKTKKVLKSSPAKKRKINFDELDLENISKKLLAEMDLLPLKSDSNRFDTT